MTKRRSFKNIFGLSLVEVIVFISIASIMMLSVYRLIDFLLRINLDNKMRLTATMIMDEKMENIRNLPYRDVGTLSGIVHGVIPDNETIISNGKFLVNTFIYYIDDPEDVYGPDGDILSADYKGVKLAVSWRGPFGSEEIISSTIVAPRGLELDVGGGILSIVVMDASGLKIENASIHVKNSLIDPPVDFTALSDENGQLTLIGAQASHEAYEISVTKTSVSGPGYSTSYTSPRTVENPNPVKPHASVVEGEKTEISFSIDLLSSLSIRTVQGDYENWMVNNDNTQRDQINGMATIADDGNMYFVWQDLRGGENSFIYIQRYPSAGSPAWSNDKKVGNSNSQFEPDIAVTDSGTFFVAWQDLQYSKEDDIYVQRVDNNGNNVWSNEVRVNSDPAGAIQKSPKIALSNDDSAMFIAWEDDRNGNFDIYAHALTADGQKIWSSDLVVANTSRDEHSVDVVFDSNDQAVIAWVEEGVSDRDIYLQKYDLDANKIFSENFLVAGSALDEYEPSLTADDDGNIYLSWTEESGDGLRNVFLAKYDENLIQEWKHQVNVDSRDRNQYEPSALYFNSYVYVSWTDERGESQDVFVQKFGVDGSLAWGEDVRINMNNDSSNQSGSYLIVNSFGPPLACWADNRNGDLDIYASNFAGADEQIPLANISLIINGDKKIYTSPDVYKYSESVSTNSQGELVISGLEWDSYLIRLPSGSPYSIVAVEPSSPVVLLPNTTQKVKIYLK